MNEHEIEPFNSQTQPFVTIGKSHPDFSRYVSGQFSNQHVALPISTLFANSPDEKVTFQIFSRQQIARPHWLLILFQVLRLDLLTFTLMPPLVVLALAPAAVQVPELVGWAFLSLFFLHGAVFCRNDYFDHLRGADRWNERGGSRVIQRGWLRAVTVHRLFLIFLTLAATSALPIFFAKPLLALISLFAVLVGVWGYSYLRAGAGPWWLSSLSVFLCLGPILTCAFSLLTYDKIVETVVIVGCYFGVIATVYSWLRHTISMVGDDEANLKTLPVKLGFDRMKSTLFFTTFVFIICSAGIYSWIQPKVTSLLALPVIIYLVFISANIYGLSSPLSSGLADLPRQYARLHLLSGVLFLLFSVL